MRMQSLQAWVETNPIILGIAAFVVILTALMLFIGIQMRRAGMSLRPIWFFLGFVAIVGGPQAVYHLSNVKSPREIKELQGPAISSEVFAIESGRFAHPQRIFGDDVDTSLIQPAKPVFPEFLST